MIFIFVFTQPNTKNWCCYFSENNIYAYLDADFWFDVYLVWYLLEFKMDHQVLWHLYHPVQKSRMTRKNRFYFLFYRTGFIDTNCNSIWPTNLLFGWEKLCDTRLKKNVHILQSSKYHAFGDGGGGGSEILSTTSNISKVQLQSSMFLSGPHTRLKFLR